MKSVHKIHLPLMAIAAMFVLSACSEMKLVNAGAVESEEDPRENIHLTGMKAEVTSGSLVQHQIESSTASLVLGVANRRLNVGTLTVASYNDKGKLQGITEAESGVVYLAADAKLKRARSDMDFSGGVEYRVPQADDPTTNSVTMVTEELRWDGTAGLFRCPSYYQMTMQSPNNMTFVAVGDGFTATRDLQKWNVKHGGIGTVSNLDMRTVNAQKGKETVELADRLAVEAVRVKEVTSPSPTAPADTNAAPEAPKPAQPEQPGTVVDTTTGRKKAVIPMMKPRATTAPISSSSFEKPE
ncbi:hypothetical protein CVU37_08605 [candidate division BRC1 bacterium HGW-BRC1-1]|jgi:hypothetical protein|nr:MAG: hypothetical protein CVU37_08605 [candidate division BRC1 bacterium HGW-BRC1-1]